jgi:hypothetical protein
MNWLPKDKAAWGIVLAIAAIVLAFPLSLLANLLTPKIRNWLAQRSAAGLRQRIAELEQELKMMETYDLLEECQEIIMVTLLRAGLVIQLACALMLGMWGSDQKHQHPASASLVIGATIIFLFSLSSASIYTFGPIRSCLRLRSSKTRTKIKEDIVRLSVKLAAFRKSSV